MWEGLCFQFSWKQINFASTVECRSKVGHSNTMRNTNLLPCLVLATLASTRLLAHAQYTAYDLGYGAAYGINSAGTIVGFLGDGVTQHAFRFSEGAMTDLGTLGGAASIAYGVNNLGRVVGRSEWSGGYWHGFSYASGPMTDLGVYSGYYSVAYGINDSGTIVGSVWTTGNRDHAAFCIGGHWTDLGTFGGNYSGAAAINASGTIVGWSDLSFGTHAFSYREGVMTDLGTFGGSVSYAMDINDSGIVVGYGSTPDDHYYQAFCYSGGVMRCIGTLGGAYSSAAAVNSAGDIVGETDIDANGDYHAFLYSGGVMNDLAPYLLPIGLAGLNQALDINDRGDIVGWGFDAEGRQHAFLLAVPEPSLVVLWMLGLAVYTFPALTKPAKRSKLRS
jgi:probable HAF family extracellular repeat protein